MLGGPREGTCDREAGLLDEEQRDTEEIRRESVKQSGRESPFLNTKRVWKSN